MYLGKILWTGMLLLFGIVMIFMSGEIKLAMLGVIALAIIPFIWYHRKIYNWFKDNFHIED